MDTKSANHEAAYSRHDASIAHFDANNLQYELQLATIKNELREELQHLSDQIIPLAGMAG